MILDEIYTFLMALVKLIVYYNFLKTSLPLTSSFMIELQIFQTQSLLFSSKNLNILEKNIF